MRGQHVASLHHLQLLREHAKAALLSQHFRVIINVQVILRFSREHNHLIAKRECVFPPFFFKEFREFPILVVLSLHSLKVHAHLCALRLGSVVGALGLFLLGSNDSLLLVEPADLMVHDFDCQELLFQELLLLNKECLRFADGAGDLFAGSLRLLLILLFLILHLFDLSLKYQFIQAVIAHFLLQDGKLALNLELLVKLRFGLAVQLVHIGGILVVELIFTLLDLVCQVLKSFFIMRYDALKGLLVS